MLSALNNVSLSFFVVIDLLSSSISLRFSQIFFSNLFHPPCLFLSPTECDWSCNACRGPLRSDCLQCMEGYVLQDGICVPGCSLGYYQEAERCLSQWSEIKITTFIMKMSSANLFSSSIIFDISIAQSVNVGSASDACCVVPTHQPLWHCQGLMASMKWFQIRLKD